MLHLRQHVLFGNGVLGHGSDVRAWYQVQTAVKDICRSVNELENSIFLTLCETPHPVRMGVLAATFYDVNIARSDLYPSLSLSGVTGWTNSLGGTVMNPSGLLLNAAAMVKCPAFQQTSPYFSLKQAAQAQLAPVGNFSTAPLNSQFLLPVFGRGDSCMMLEISPQI